MTYPNRWCPKGLREHLCQQQTYAPDAATRRELQRVINLMDYHRPVCNDGKHDDRHTPTCGCEDKEEI